MQHRVEGLNGRDENDRKFLLLQQSGKQVKNYCNLLPSKVFSQEDVYTGKACSHPFFGVWCQFKHPQLFRT